MSSYIQYHYLLFNQDPTGSNAFIGAWQKKLGHQRLWEDFNLGYKHGPPIESPRVKHTGSHPTRSSTPRFADCFSDSSLTPLTSENEEPTSFTKLPQAPPLPSSESVVLRSAVLSTYDMTDSSDDPMNGTSVSALCLSPGTGLTLAENHPKSLSAPVPTSSSPHRKRRRKTDYRGKKKSSKRNKGEPVEEIADKSMIIDAGLQPQPEHASTESVRQATDTSEPFKISIALVPSTSPENQLPLSTSCTNVQFPPSEPLPNPDPSPEALNGLGDAPVTTAPGLSRPALPRDPPIWAQVWLFFFSSFV